MALSSEAGMYRPEGSVNIHKRLRDVLREMSYLPIAWKIGIGIRDEVEAS